MALQVIGAGWGRTGTESIKMALEQLGFTKCYHGFEILENPDHLMTWKEIRAGLKPDYAALFKGDEAAVDFPAAYYYRELLEQYPDAKVVLSVRDAESWYQSSMRTILKRPQPLKIAVLKLLGNFSGRLHGVHDAILYLHGKIFHIVVLSIY